MLEQTKVGREAQKAIKALNLGDLIDKNPLNPQAIASAMKIIAEEDLLSDSSRYDQAAEQVRNRLLEVSDYLFATDKQKSRVIREFQDLYDDFWKVIGLPEVEERRELYRTLIKAGALDFKKVLKAWEKSKELLSDHFDLLKEEVIAILERNVNEEQQDKVQIFVGVFLSTLAQYVDRALLQFERQQWKDISATAIEMIYALDGALLYLLPTPAAEE